MNLHRIASLVPVLLLLGMTALGQDAPPKRLSLSERAFLAGKVYGSVLLNFAHWQDVPDLDIDVAYRQYLERALASDDRLAFGRGTMEFLVRFRNSHTMLLDQALIGQGGRLPFAARFLAGQWVITESWIRDVRPGDVIESIDGQTFERFFADRRRFISASTEPWARRALFARMPGFAVYAHLLPERFVLGLEGGRQVSVDRRSAADSGLPSTDGHWLDPGKVAYIRIPSFSTPGHEKRAVELLHEFRDAASLVIDVRGNAGGSTPGQLTSLLMDRPYRWWTESTPVMMPYFRFRASEGKWEYQPFNRPEFLWRSGTQAAESGAFKGKLVLLIDAGCHSACEDFVMPFKDNGRATLVGEQTAGSTGQPYIVQLTPDLLVLIGAKREMFPDSSRFEGVGIKPDLEASPSPADIRRGADSVLEVARKLLAGS